GILRIVETGNVDRKAASGHIKILVLSEEIPQPSGDRFPAGATEKPIAEVFAEFFVGDEIRKRWAPTLRHPHHGVETNLSLAVVTTFWHDVVQIDDTRLPTVLLGSEAHPIASPVHLT